MNKIKREQIPAIILAFCMLVSMILVFAVTGSAAEGSNQYTLKVSDLEGFAAGAKDDGDYVRGGTDDFFTVFYSEKAKIEGNEKTFSDGEFSSHRIAWGDKTFIGEDILNAVKFKTLGSGKVKIWWVCGDPDRQVALFSPDGTVVAQTNISEATHTPVGEDGFKNDLFISEFDIPSAGIYYIGNVGGSNYFYQVAVTDSEDGGTPAARADWAGVAAPSISSAADDGAGKMVVNVNALVGHDGADELLVHMYKDGELIATKGSVTEKSAHTLKFTPADSGTYTFKAELVREGCDAKASAEASASFVYVLRTPTLSSVTNMGGGSVELQWTAVHEAEAYVIYKDGVMAVTVTSDSTSYTIDGLTIGQEYSFQISAIRGNEELKSAAKNALVTAEKQIAWAFTVYGPSASPDKNTCTGDLNKDGSVTIVSSGNGGKIQPEKNDGLAFYYTSVPTEYNFTLRAKVTINSWSLSNGQEGFGLIAMDRLPTPETDPYDYWNNSYLAGSTKIEYKYREGDEGEGEIVDNKVVDSSLKKFSMKLGIGSITRTGVTLDNIAAMSKNHSATIKEFFVSRYYPLDITASETNSQGGTYNIIGNYTNDPAPAGTVEERFLITEYIMEITKNNTGYLISYYDAETEELISSKQYYDPDALNQLDSENVYVGFFAARNANITFSDVYLSTILCSEDADRVYPPTEYVTPTVTVNSASVTTSKNYELIVDANVAGTLTVKYRDEIIAENEKLDMYERFRTIINLFDYDENYIKIEFTPDPYQVLGEYIELSSTKTLYVTHELMYNRGNYHRKTVYISPDVLPHTTTADGTKENPFDIFTALENAYPGQTLILMEGRYTFSNAGLEPKKGGLKIQRGMDGTADAMIRLIADPDAKTRPVLDFEGTYTGLTHGGDYWYFYGFDITGSCDMEKGFLLAGSHNILDQINTYENGNTGIQLSRLSGSDLYEDWPSYNLILNCTSYRNYDGGFEDADGFAAKLTIGDGNVFDGCIAYNNADDGWDLYAKAGTGAIGAVTIRNCISYENGFVPGAGSKTGNGNGFKLGGESIPGKHVLENSIAFNNLAKGIDSNSCPDIIVKNCISFNNGSHNVAFYTNNADNTAFVASGLISFRTEKLDIAENLKPKGEQIVGNYMNATTFYWNADNSFCINNAGEKITADMFVSLEFKGFTRNEDGTINLGGFLEIKDTVPEGVKNCKLGGQASDEIVLIEDEECSFGRAWYKLDPDAHWHYCECGNKSHIEVHDFIWITDKAQVGNQEGLKHQECIICGYKKAAITIYPEYQPPVEEPDDNNADDTTEELGFFAKIWQAIVNFFKSIFGGLFGGNDEEAFIPSTGYKYPLRT